MRVYLQTGGTESSAAAACHSLCCQCAVYKHKTVEEVHATSAPSQHGRREALAVHRTVMCTFNLSRRFLPISGAGQPVGSHHSSTERDALGAAWTARVSCCTL
jgi:hypothetical protein